MIQVEHLTKVFGQFTAVNNLSFQADCGEVLGFLGPNGAGKSTTMKMITGYLQPDHGRVVLTPQSDRYKGKSIRHAIGYLPEGAPIYADMSVKDFLTFIAGVRGFVGREKNKAVKYVIGLLQLESVAAQMIDTLSKGFTRRVGLAQALIHDPEILILDEPTDGLDPNQKHHVRSLIQEFATEKLVIVSTHILEEVSAICSRALIIAQGALKFDGSPEALLNKSEKAHQVMVRFENQGIDIGQLQNLPLIHTAKQIDASGFVLKPAANETAFIGAFIQICHSKGWVLSDIQKLTPQLDEVFRALTTSGKEPI